MMGINNVDEKGWKDYNIWHRKSLLVYSHWLCYETHFFNNFIIKYEKFQFTLISFIWVWQNGNTTLLDVIYKKNK